MKLIQKTSQVYLVFSVVLFTLAGLSIYFALTALFDEETTEKMITNKNRIVFLLSKGGIVSSAPPVLEVEKINHQITEKLIIKDTLIYDEIENDTELFKEVTSFESINGRWYRITIRQVSIEAHDFYQIIGLVIAGILVLMLFSLWVIHKRIFNKLWKPFYDTLEKLEQFSVQNNEETHFVSSNIVEFDILSNSLKDLTEQVRRDYRTLKEFSENAAHEMQTPISIIQSKLEELLQLHDLQEDQANQIKQAFTSLHQLSRLNQDLLLLTKIENQQFNKMEAVNLSSEVNNILDDLQDLINSKSIQLQKLVEKKVQVNAHLYLIRILLSNLIGNSIKHNIEHGQIKIELTEKFLQISNTGDVLNIDPELLFERFMKNKPTSKSVGLGLAIAQKICNNFQWTIQYNCNEEWHFITINF